MSNGKLDKSWPLATLTTVALAMAGFSLAWLFNANAELKLLQASLTQLQTDTEGDAKRDATLQKHWKLHSWAKDQINELRNKHDELEGVASWPDLTVSMPP